MIGYDAADDSWKGNTVVNSLMGCSVCRALVERGVALDESKTNVEWADILGVSETSVRRHKKHKVGDINYGDPATSGESETHNPDGSASYVRFSQEPWGYEDYRDFIRATGQDPDEVTFSWGWTSHPQGGFWNKLLNVRAKGAHGDGPAWPVVQPAQPAKVTLRGSVKPIQRAEGFKVALKCADTQIGYRILADGSLDPFHDESAMAVFVAAVRAYTPDKVTILGDFLDLPSQGKYAQEASFAQTTQLAINRGYQFLAEIRAAAPDAEIVLIEGNHDARLQSYIERNALAAFGLKQAGKPDSWPVLSLPNLMRLDELGVKYIDAYPAGADWDNDSTRNIHGTKVNSRGSTTSQYAHELPHINTWAGHTHRCEITYRTVLGPRGEAIESYAANPGVLCRTDGAVPSVNGAIGTDGLPAKVVEDWQSGFGVLYYNETESWPAVYRIRNGVAIVNGQRISA